MKSLIEALERRALLSGEVDTTFGTNGVVTADFALYSERFAKVVVGQDGKIYAAGNVGANTLVARYTAAGKPDLTFNGTGSVILPAASSVYVGGLAVRADGGVYLNGNVSALGSNAPGVVALTANGTLDSTFSGDGFWTGKWSNAVYNRGGGAVVYGNQLYVSGNDSNGYLYLARFTSAGDLDPAFGFTGAGKVAINAGTAVSNYNPDLLLLPTPGAAPRLLLATSSQDTPVLAVFSLAGVQEANRLPVPYAGGSFYMEDVAVDSTGRIVVGGRLGAYAAVSRLTASGYVDTGFGDSGYWAVTDSYRVSSVAVTRDGQVVATMAGPTGSLNSRVLYLTATGQPNFAAFTNGIGTLPVGQVYDATVGYDGKVVLAGNTRGSLGSDSSDSQLGRLNAPPVTVGIDGFLFDDVNGDGLRNDTGGRLTFYGMAAYLDLNTNGTLDAGEPTAYAGNGKFVFDNLVPNTTYTVRLHVYPGITARQTFPADNGGFVVTTTGTYNSAGPFGVSFTPAPTTFTVSGTVFIDANKNGTIDGTEVEDRTLTGWYVYVDTNNSGGVDDDDLYVAATTSSNKYTLTLPADGRTYRVQLRNENAEPFTTAAYYDVSSTSGQPVTGRDFGIAPVTPGASASGVVFDDVNQNGKQDIGEAGRVNAVVYVDLDNDKILDANETWQYTDSGGVYTFSDLPDTGTVTRLRAVVPAGDKQTTPVDGKGYGLNLAVGAANPDKHFGLYTPPPAPVLGSLSGFCFDDTDKDGVYDSTEKKTSGKTVFLDTDNDGVLDSGETKTTTLADGSWSFNNLAAGTYRVRRVFPSGYTQSTTPIDVALAAGQAVTDLALGSKAGSVTPTNTASITGSVFTDNNKNGKYDTGDGYAKGVVVFLDTDNDGKLDSGETSTTTDSSGKFNFTKLAAGTYRVRRVMPSGYTYSTTKPDVTLTSGQAKSGVLIGTKKA